MKIDTAKLREKLQEIDMPEPERLAIMRVCAAIGLLKNDLVGTDAEDYYKIRAERDELAAWKESMLKVMIDVLRRSPLALAEGIAVCVYCEKTFNPVVDHLGQHKETCPWQIAVIGECRR